MKVMLAVLAFWSSGSAGAQEAGLDPLEDALWRGELTVAIQGPVYGQYLANKKNNQGVPIGFVKEKAQMVLDASWRIEFLVNPLGEYTLLAFEKVDVKQSVTHEFWYRFREEQKLRKNRMRFDEQLVQVSETTQVEIAFERQEVYRDEAFDFGEFRLLPSGRMDRKGQLRVIGNFEVPIRGEGKVVFTKERQPPSKSYNKLEKISDIKKSLVLPVQFDFQIDHRKKEIFGSFTVASTLENPLRRESVSYEEGSYIYNPTFKATGSYRLTPLFN